MRRIHGVELSDQSWFPQLLRDASISFLRLGGRQAGHARMIHPIIRDALRRSSETRILDLCSGGGGQALSLLEEFERSGEPLELTLTDIYPNEGARELAAQATGLARYEPAPVDVRDVPAERAGLRTLLNAFHHFRPEEAKGILASAVEAGRPIAILEVVRRNALTALAILGTPIHVLLIVPFLRPLRWSWLPLTYLVPVLPFTILWDALFSCLRAYSRDELLAMARAADPEDGFVWEVEEPAFLGPIRGISLVGIPKQRLTQRVA